MKHLASGDLPDLPALPAELLVDLAPPVVPLIDAAGSGFQPDPDLTVSQWADSHRILASSAASEPGPYRTARAPMLREIMDALSPSHPAQRVTFMKGAQIGGSEAGNNWLGFIIAHAPGPVIAVQPTVELAKRFSKQRIDPMVESTPALRNLVAPARARDSGNTMLQKDFPGGTLVLTGANSAVGLRSMPARYCFADEVDAWPADVEGEGDPIALAAARLKTYGWRKKIFLVSTPKFAGTSRIEREYLASDARKYHVPCPHCGHMQHLRFENLRWTKGQPDTAAYHCEACGAAAGEADKTRMLAEGEWRATATPKDPLSIGFHLSSLYSPVGWMSWAEVAAGWEKALEAGTEALRSFKNTVLGETWVEHGDAPDWERLFERREPFQMGVVPAGVKILTAAIDNQAQPARLELAIWGWADNYESWLIDAVVIDGDPGGDDAWAKAKAIMDQPLPCEGGGSMRISAIAVDTGGQHTNAVYLQLRRLRDRRVIPIKGIGGWNRASPVTGPTMVDITQNGRKITRGLRLWSVSSDVLKAELYRRLWLARNDDGSFPAGWVHLSEGMDAEQVKQLCSEQLITVKDRRGYTRMEFHRLRPNEMLDLAVYCRAALSVLGSDRYGDRFWARLKGPEPVSTAPPALPPSIPSKPAPAPTYAPPAPPMPTPSIPRVAGVTITTAAPPAAPRRSFAGRLAGG